MKQAKSISLMASIMLFAALIFSCAEIPGKDNEILNEEINPPNTGEIISSSSQNQISSSSQNQNSSSSSIYSSSSISSSSQNQSSSSSSIYSSSSISSSSQNQSSSSSEEGDYLQSSSSSEEDDYLQSSSSSEEDDYLQSSSSVSEIVTIPYAPTGLTVRTTVILSSTTYNISWNAVSNATSYEIYGVPSRGRGYTLIVSSTSNGYRISASTVENYTAFCVKAVNSAGASDYSETVTKP